MGGLAVLALLGFYVFLAIILFKIAKTTSTKVIAVLLILLTPTADAIYGRAKLQQMCKAEGGLKVYREAHNVEGFMYESNDERLMTQYGYQFIEIDEYPGESEYEAKRLGLKKYTRLFNNNGQIEREVGVIYKSKYRVKTRNLNYHPTIIDEKRPYDRFQDSIEEIESNEILATDTQIAFNGGWAERLIALFSDAGGSSVAWCNNVASDHWQRKVKLFTSSRQMLNIQLLSLKKNFLILRYLNTKKKLIFLAY